MTDAIEERFRAMFTRYALGKKPLAEELRDFADEIAGRRAPPLGCDACIDLGTHIKLCPTHQGTAPVSLYPKELPR